MNGVPASGYEATASVSGDGAAGGERPARLSTDSIQDILLRLALVILLPALILQLGLHVNSFQQQRDDVMRANLELARLAGTALESHLQGVASLEDAVGSALASRAFEADYARNAYLASAIKGHETVRELLWLDPRGGVLASSASSAKGLELGDRPYVRAVNQGDDWAVSDLLLAWDTGAPTVVVARPIRDRTGWPEGIVLALLDPDRLHKVLLADLGRHGSVAVFDGQGRLVSQYPPVEALTWEQREAAGRIPFVRTALGGQVAQGEFTGPLETATRIGAVAPVRAAGWATLASRLEAEALAPLWGGFLRDLGVWLLVTALALGMAVASGRSISSPMQRLGQYASALGKGNRASSLEVGGPGEVGDLADALRRMAADIAEREETLQRANEHLARVSLGAQVSAEEAERRAAELDAVINALPNGVILLGRGGEISRINPAAMRIFAYSPEELRMSHAQRLDTRPLYSPEGRVLASAERPTTRAIRGETVHGLVGVIKRAGDVPVWVSISAAPVTARDGSVLGVVATYVDISRQQVLQEQRDDFMRAVSHDLRQPLTVITGQAQLLRHSLQKALDARVDRGLSAIESSARRIRRMIDDLLDAVRLESGQVTLRAEPLDVRELIAEVCERRREHEQAGRVRLLAPASSVSVHADADALERVFANLIDNALKYSPAETEVVVTVAVDGNWVVVSVEDRGVGIAATDLPHLFERYYRARSAERRAEGLGLGLYITRGLVEAHGGTIGVESAPSQGSTFAVRLPRLED